MNRQYLIMMEKAGDTRYEFYLQGIERSNLDSTIVRWELRYDRIKNLGTGSSVSFGNREYGKLDEVITKLTNAGFVPVTFETKTFC